MCHLYFEIIFEREDFCTHSEEWKLTFLECLKASVSVYPPKSFDIRCYPFYTRGNYLREVI